MQLTGLSLTTVSLVPGMLEVPSQELWKLGRLQRAAVAPLFKKPWFLNQRTPGLALPVMGESLNTLEPRMSQF